MQITSCAPCMFNFLFIFYTGKDFNNLEIPWSVGAVCFEFIARSRCLLVIMLLLLLVLLLLLLFYQYSFDISYHRDELPKPTTALDYTFGRKAKGHNIVREFKVWFVVFNYLHIWQKHMIHNTLYKKKFWHEVFKFNSFGPGLMCDFFFLIWSNFTIAPSADRAD